MTSHGGESTLPFEDGRSAGDERTSARDGSLAPGDDTRPCLKGIWIKRAKGGPMDSVEAAVLDAGRGLAGNANRGGRRQVTIIAAERWAAISGVLGVPLDPSTRRANLLIRGLDLERSRGRILRVGSARLKINGETRPCQQMEEAHPGLQAVMRDHWGGGVFAEVLEDAEGRQNVEIRVGDAVAWEALARRI